MDLDSTGAKVQEPRTPLHVATDEPKTGPVKQNRFDIKSYDFPFWTDVYAAPSIAENHFPFPAPNCVPDACYWHRAVFIVQGWLSVSSLMTASIPWLHKYGWHSWLLRHNLFSKVIRLAIKVILLNEAIPFSEIIVKIMHLLQPINTVYGKVNFEIGDFFIMFPVLRHITLTSLDVTCHAECDPVLCLRHNSGSELISFFRILLESAIRSICVWRKWSD